ncbi:MAG: antA/AntB antirepressor family protein [Hominisplanchenecus sp.]
MNDLFNEVFGDVQKQTPIEIALGVDEQGMTTAKKLYVFLEFDPSHYAKWFKKNILENNFAEENKDYWVFAPQCENPLGGRPTQDARLTASFAKKLSMMQKNQKGEAARNYFVGVENGAKKLMNKVPITEHPGEVANYLKEMDRRLEKQGTAPWKICEAFKMVSEQFGIRLPDDFVKVPEYEQMELLL